MRERHADIAARLGPPLGVGLVLGLLGPFGTFDLLAPMPRVAYWILVVSMNWLLADVAVRSVSKWAGDKVPVRWLSVPCIGALIVAFPATGIVALANGLSGIGWPDNVPLLFFQVLLLLVAIGVPVCAWEEARARGAVDSAAGAADTAQGQDASGSPQPQGGSSLFAARFARPLEGQLICLEMQDHYLIVHSTGGSTMILCRMEDAARELNGTGRRVHRSWWVAQDAVAGTEREGQRTFLRLTDDRRVPVGRSFKAELKDAGWL